MRVRAFVTVIVLALVIGPWAQCAEAFDTSAKQAILIDLSTGTVLFKKNADELTHPSSMTKMMTLYLLFERLADGSLKLDDTLPVSKKAWQMGGSRMFEEVGSRVKIADLIPGVIVDSGNDAAVTIAQGLDGTEAAFAHEMNEKARDLGMDHTHFVNASGWPVPDHLTTVRDLATLAEHLIKDFPQYYHYFSEKSFTYDGIKQGNRNPLLFNTPGADGLKTGHTEAGGYGLAGSAVRNGRRLLEVINGVDSVQGRGTEGQRLLEWGFREFDDYSFFKKGATVGDAAVWLGADNAVPLVVNHDVRLTMPRASHKNMKVKIVYDGPIPAPITKGTPIAKLVISAPNMETVEVPLLAGKDVGKLSLVNRLGAAIKYLVLGPPATNP